MSEFINNWPETMRFWSTEGTKSDYFFRLSEKMLFFLFFFSLTATCSRAKWLPVSMNNLRILRIIGIDIVFLPPSKAVRGNQGKDISSISS